MFGNSVPGVKCPPNGICFHPNPSLSHLPLLLHLSLDWIVETADWPENKERYRSVREIWGSRASMISFAKERKEIGENISLRGAINNVFLYSGRQRLSYRFARSVGRRRRRRRGMHVFFAVIAIRIKDIHFPLEVRWIEWARRGVSGLREWNRLQNNYFITYWQP